MRVGMGQEGSKVYSVRGNVELRRRAPTFIVMDFIGSLDGGRKERLFAVLSGRVRTRGRTGTCQQLESFRRFLFLLLELLTNQALILVFLLVKGSFC